MSTAPYEPRVGQVYSSRHTSDIRYGIRQRVEVVEVEPERIRLRNQENGQRTWIKRSRLRNVSGGYLLFKDAA